MESRVIAKCDKDLMDISNVADYTPLMLLCNYLNRGGYGEFYGPFRYQGWKCVLKRQYFASENSSEKQRTQDLIRCRKALDHPNLIKILNHLNPDDPVQYTVLEYGVVLSHILRPPYMADPRKDFGADVFESWLFQITFAMEYLHDKDILVKALHAGRIFGTDFVNGLPTIMKLSVDFNLDNGSGSIKHSNVIEYAWLAPESLLSEYTKQSDMWGFGVTVFEIITRQLPYHENAKSTDVIPSPETLIRLLPDKYPRPLRTLVELCCNLDPKARPTFKEIAEFLQKSDWREII